MSGQGITKQLDGMPRHRPAMHTRRLPLWSLAHGLLLSLALVLAFGQSAVGWRVKRARQSHVRPVHAASTRAVHERTASRRSSQARLTTVSRRHGRKSKGGAKAAAVSRAQVKLAQEMTHEAYTLGERLEAGQRAALLSRLLYTMRPEVMAAEKKQWAEELFSMAQRLPKHGTKPSVNSNGAPDPLKANDDTQAAPGLTAVGCVSCASRDAVIATAAARLALYDSDRALELLDTLPSEGGRREDARTMAARLVFAVYMQRHGASGAQTLLAHAKLWGEHGGFPYGASSVALARLRTDEDAAEEFFRQALAEFERGQEGAFGVAEFAGLLERAVAIEAISEDAAEEAGHAIVSQAEDLAGGGASAAGPGGETRAGEGGSAELKESEARAAAADEVADAGAAAPLDEEAEQQLAAAMDDVRVAAPKAYAQAEKDWPALVRLRPARLAIPAEETKVDSGLQASFGELAEALRTRSGPEALRESIARGLERVNERYKAGAGAGGSALAANCGHLTPDRQSWALVSLAAYASPYTIDAQLKAIQDPFWHAYFLAIAAQQVGEPTRVADPTASRVEGKEEAEPE